MLSYVRNGINLVVEEGQIAAMVGPGRCRFKSYPSNG